jgi:hypothetical protein
MRYKDGKSCEVEEMRSGGDEELRSALPVVALAKVGRSDKIHADPSNPRHPHLRQMAADGQACPIMS